jgi:hypothetical protein
MPSFFDLGDKMQTITAPSVDGDQPCAGRLRHVLRHALRYRGVVYSS